MAALKLKFKCGSCNWKFTRNYTPQLCPYCGKGAVSTDITQGAQDLLREFQDLNEE